MINGQILIENGYEKYNDQLNQSSWYIGSYQKKIVSEDGVMMFINVHEMDVKELPEEAAPNYRFYSKAQFQTDETESKTFDVTLHLNAKTMTPGDIEAFFTKMWEVMSCQYAN